MTTSDNDSYESCITIAEDPSELAAHDNDKIKQTQHSSENEENKCLAKLENVLSNATATDESVSSSSFTNSISAASINSRTALGVKNNNNGINTTNSPSSALSSSSAAGGAATGSVRHHQQRNRVLSFHLNGTVVHRRRPNSASKNPIHMLTNLFASMMGGERAARKYGVKRQILQRTRSSLRRPQLVSVRSRGSVFNQQKRHDMITMDDDNENNNNNNDFVDTTRENAFDMLLRFCETPADVAFLRSHPDHLERLGIPVEQYSTILEELNFFLIKREQLREAEQRVRERKQKREKKK
ncbi:hypothetical protein niasHS_009184 [Heterodera schachtii]|uniref:Uncharacterized protein n=1 Tax=Heterodera schachtii TaxID=97005 RepID=A0ABD2JE78_HETSC